MLLPMAVIGRELYIVTDTIFVSPGYYHSFEEALKRGNHHHTVDTIYIDDPRIQIDSSASVHFISGKGYFTSKKRQKNENFSK